MKIQFFAAPSTGIAIAAALTSLFCLSLAGQETPSKERAAKGLPPRATPADYQAHAQAGTVTLAADFAEHGVPTTDAVFSTEDYVIVELAFFGPPAAHLNVSYKDFSLRLDGKKALLPAQPYESAFSSLKDPEWTPPVTESKSKTGIGGGGQSDSAPAPVHMPIGMKLAMEQKVQKASLPEGDRPLPEAGLLFFSHRSKVNGGHTVELIYDGAAGKAKLTLQQ
jgi:hypothetical protein